MDGGSFEPRQQRRRNRRRRVWRLVVVAAAVVFLVVVGATMAWERLAGGRHDAEQPAANAAAGSPSPRATQARPSTAPSPSSRPTASLPPRPHFVKHPQPVPILVYHHVLKRSKGPRLLDMSSARFRSQMAYLASHGYEAVTLRRVYDAWTGAGTLPPRAVVITFDDGYVDQVRNAAPLLAAQRWPAVLDLVFTALYMGTSRPPNRLTPAMVKGLLDQGWELSSHSLTHPDLTRLYGARLRRQLVVSKRRLRETFHVPVDFFCYPGGLYDRRVKLAVRRAGYLAATGTRYGAATPKDLFSLPRIYCYGGESDAVFGARLKETLAAAQT